MNVDARISVGLPSHPKTKKLIRRGGQCSAWNLVCLFLWVSQNKPSGDLSSLSVEDIEIASGWEGEEGKFVQMLSEVGFLDGAEGSFAVHDWEQHNPWACGSERRSENSRIAARKRWGIEEKAEPVQKAPIPDACGIPDCGDPICDPHATRIAEVTNPQSPVSDSVSVTESLPKPEKEKPAPKAPSLSVADLVSEGLDAAMAAEFLEHRRRKKAVLTPLAWRGFKAEVGKAGWTLAAAVEKSISRGWTGFEASWVAGDGKPNRLATPAAGTDYGAI